MELAYRYRERLPLRGRLTIAGHYHAYRGRQDSALHCYRIGVERNPDDGTLRNHIGMALARMGRLEESLVDSLHWQSPYVDWALREHERLGQIAWGYALAGDIGSAREIVASMDSVLENNDFEPRGVGEAVSAIIALREMRAEDAVEHLRRAGAATGGYLAWDYRFFLADTA